MRQGVRFVLSHVLAKATQCIMEPSQLNEQQLQRLNARIQQHRQKFSAATATGSILHVCDYMHCKTTGAAKKCKACLSRTYCDKRCQKKDWKLQHRHHCKTSLPPPAPVSPEQLWRELSSDFIALEKRAKDMAFSELSWSYRELCRGVAPGNHGIDHKDLIATYCAHVQNSVPKEGVDYKLATIWSKFKEYAESHREMLSRAENPGTFVYQPKFASSL